MFVAESRVTKEGRSDFPDSTVVKVIGFPSKSDKVGN